MSDNSKNNDEKDPAEIRAVYLENRGRALDNLKPRTRYGGKIDPSLLKNPPNNKMPRLDSGGLIGTNGQHIILPQKKDL